MIDDSVNLEIDEARKRKNYEFGANVIMLSKAICINFFSNIYRNPILKKYDFISQLNTFEKRIILNLGSTNENNIKTLAREIGAKQKSMHYPLNSLKKQGLIELIPGSYDKRETIARLSEKGRKMLEDYNEANLIAKHIIFQKFDESELDRLNTIVKEAAEALVKGFPLLESDIEILFGHRPPISITTHSILLEEDVKILFSNKEDTKKETQAPGCRHSPTPR